MMSQSSVHQIARMMKDFHESLLLFTRSVVFRLLGWCAVSCHAVFMQ